MKYLRWWLLSCVVFLVGCTTDINETSKDRPEVIQTQKIFQAIIRNDVAFVRASFSDEANKATSDEALNYLIKIAPKEPPQSENILGWHYTKTKSAITGESQRNSDVTIEYYYGDNHWLLVQAQYIGEENGLKAQIFNLQFNNQSSALKPMLWYSLAGFNTGNYLALIVAVVSLLFSFYVAIKCYKTPDLKRKWWWIAFCIFGVVHLSVSSYAVATSVNFNILSIIFLSPLRNWASGIAFPVGALWTYLHLRGVGVDRSS